MAEENIHPSGIFVFLSGIFQAHILYSYFSVYISHDHNRIINHTK